ncbi:MAG TPA: nucleotide sugar dehydrogenase [Euryarchaeota archaeon]|nr:nucleotide sugar dehydrogenase [Euryarchaeota archaeon]
MDYIEKINKRELTIAVVGLGYVGLPTALGFASKGFKVIGVDLNKGIVDKLNQGKSHIEELGIEEVLRNALNEGLFKATTDGVEAARKSDVSIICVPTPVTEAKTPDLTAVLSAGRAIARGLAREKLVVLESTVHPTCSENELKSVLETSGLKAGEDFGIAYVPERYNPGDEEHTVDKVVRVVGAINEKWLEATAELYKLIARDVYKVKNLRTAEAAKIIENIQRDLNIALMNELALIFDKLNVDVFEVIEAAATKWNFVKYYPGAGVGGHCLPVDPYYLTFKAQQLGYHPKVILAGRSVNDSMPSHVVNLVVRGLNNIGNPVKGSKIVVLGISYKKNTGDIRNTPSDIIISELNDMKAEVYAYDPYIIKEETEKKGAIYSKPMEIFDEADCIILATDHDDFSKLDMKKVKSLAKQDCLIVDGRGFFDKSMIISIGFEYMGVGRDGSVTHG